MPHFGRRQDGALIVSTLVLGTLLITKCIQRRVKRRDRSTGKPQAHFAKVLADNSDAPFEHRSGKSRLLSKAEPAGSALDDPTADVYQHPLSRDILKLLRNNHPNAASVLKESLSLPIPLSCSGWDWVDSAEKLQRVTEELKGAQQIAVDLEHHALRSYLGITCLLQLSTGDKEYLVDALALHDHMHLLQDVLEDARVVKVLHGGENDISWLQRDFHLYLVNVFDTEKACQVLGYEERSLAHLLQRYCGVTANKQYQRADWRVRPLAKELVDYARTDVHFLVYIADVLRSELAARGPDALEDACRRSHLMSLNLYSKPTSQASVAGAVNAVLRKHAAAADTSSPGVRVTECIYVLCRWRDHTAREQDESPQYIMPDALLLSLATTPPSSPEELFIRATKANSAWSLPLDSQLLLKRHGAELCRLLEEAQLGMHPWQQGQSAAAAGKQRRTAEEAAERRRKLVASFCAKSPVYENCRMLSMDGAPLSFIDLRKLQWYEARGLAERVSDDPPTIRLLFRHKAADQATGADVFYGERKLNCCVACGNSTNYLRYRVVPACYRRYFPVHLKSHRSHDVVLLCFDCHQIAHQAAERMKQTIAREYGVPLLPPVPPPTEGAAAAGMPEKALHPTNIRRSALALQYHAASMPAERRESLTALVRAYVGGSTAAADVQQPLTEPELQEGLMAGFGARARRKHMQRHAASKSADARTGADADADISGSQELASGADAAEGSTNAHPVPSSSDGGRPVSHDMPAEAEREAQEQLPAQGNGHHLSEEEVACKNGLDSEHVSDSNQAAAEEQPGSSHESEGLQMQAADAELAGEQPAQITLAAAVARDLNKGGHQWHGRKVVEAVLERGGEEELCALMARFRQCFVDALQPQHLSSSWQIDHSAKRAFGDYSVYSSHEPA